MTHGNTTDLERRAKLWRAIIGRALEEVAEEGDETIIKRVIQAAADDLNTPPEVIKALVEF